MAGNSTIRRAPLSSLKTRRAMLSGVSPSTNGTESLRKDMIRKALIDAAVSMVVAFAIAIVLVNYEQIALAMVVLILFMLTPFIRIVKHRRLIR